MSGMTEEQRIEKISKWILVVFFALLIFSILLSACEPEAKITFENNQNQDVKIFVSHVRADRTIDGFVEKGTVSSHTEKTLYITFLGNNWINRIEAVDPSGNVVFLGDYKMVDLEKINWKIIILQ